jgi:antitoxin StbD
LAFFKEPIKELKVQAIYADATVSMSEFKKNPAAVLRAANSRPVAVLNHNKAAFYLLEPALFEAMLEELSDQELSRKVLARMGERAQAIEADIDAI